MINIIKKIEKNKEEVMENISRANKFTPPYVKSVNFELKPSFKDNDKINLYFYTDKDGSLKLCPYHVLKLDNNYEIIAYQLVPKNDCVVFSIKKQNISYSNKKRDEFLNGYVYRKKNKNIIKENENENFGNSKALHYQDEKYITLWNYYNKISSEFMRLSHKKIYLNNIIFLSTIDYLFLPYIKCLIYSVNTFNKIYKIYSDIPEQYRGALILAGFVYYIDSYDKDILISNRIAIPKWRKYANSNNFKFYQTNEYDFYHYHLSFNKLVYVPVLNSHLLKQTFFITENSTILKLYNKQTNMTHTYLFNGLMRIELRDKKGGEI